MLPSLLSRPLLLVLLSFAWQLVLSVVDEKNRISKCRANLVPADLQSEEIFSVHLVELGIDVSVEIQLRHTA